MATKYVEQVHVTIESGLDYDSEDTYCRVELQVLAFTRTPYDFNETLLKHQVAYLKGEPNPSIGDFALYLLAQAALEPRFIEV